MRWIKQSLDVGAKSVPLYETWTLPRSVQEKSLMWASHLAGLLALHDLEDGVFECVVDEGRRRGLHVLLHQGAGQGGRSEQCGGFIWLAWRRIKKIKTFIR